MLYPTVSVSRQMLDVDLQNTPFHAFMPQKKEEARHLWLLLRQKQDTIPASI